MARLRALYCDLDGTLLGRGASLLHDGEGGFSLAGVRALEACWRADVEVVLYSGRRRAQLVEAARLLGLTSFVYELGAAVCVDGEDLVLAGDWTHAAIAASGAPQLLLERFAGLLEPHTPWDGGRAYTHLLRGVIDPAEADAVLADAGLGELRLADNGPIARRSPSLPPRPARAFHLLAGSVSKAAGVAAHMRARGLAPEECVAVGDAPADLDVAYVVGAFWLVANAPEAAGTPWDVVRRAEAAHGAGVYEAVITELSERR
jgi:phosphoglycolate phosphatase